MFKFTLAFSVFGNSKVIFDIGACGLRMNEKQKAYVYCMLWDPKKWDVNIERAEAQKLLVPWLVMALKREF